MSPQRLTSTVVASLLAAASVATPVFAGPPDGKGTPSKEHGRGHGHGHGHGHKARARLDHGHTTHHASGTGESSAAKPSNDPPARDSSAKDSSAKAKTTSDEKKAPDADPKSEDPPPELTGSLPQAKLATRKPRAKADAADKDSKDAKRDDKRDDASGKQGGKKGAPEHEADAKKPNADGKGTREGLREGEVRTGDGKLPPLPAAHPTKGKVGYMSPSFDADVSFPNLQRKAVDARKPKLRSCLNPAVSFTRLGQPTNVQVVLTTCTGDNAPGAVERLSVLARPYEVPAPAQPESILALPKHDIRPSQVLSTAALMDEVAPGIRRVDAGLVQRAQAIANRFGNRTITVVSGYRPASKGSPHAAARAMDIRIDGVTNESLVEFCKTLKDTGCGYYPNSSFVHVDVRPPGTGHVHWIDISGPGEKPVYVKQWPLPAAPAPKMGGDLPDDLPSATTDEGAIGPLEDKDLSDSDPN